MYIQLEVDGQPIRAKVVATLYHEGKRLFAVIATVDNAPWYGLIHEDSDAIVAFT
jgi:hypothetical protein